MSACRTCYALDCFGDDDYRLYSLQTTLYPAVVPSSLNIPGAIIRFLCCDGSVLSRTVSQGMSYAQFLALVGGMLAECALKVPGCIPGGDSGGDSETTGDTTPTPVVLFASRSTSCSASCPDGGYFSYTVRAGAFVGLSQSAADAAASSIACSEAEEHKICLSSLSITGCVGTSISGNVIASGAYINGSATWSVTSGSLPAGLTLTGNGTFATISGTPTTAGTTAFTVRVTASNGDYMVKSFSITIYSVTPTTLASQEEDIAYSQQMTMASSVGAVAWTVSSGSLPSGLSLSASGLLSGTPTTPGDSTFTLSATDSEGATCSRSFTLTITAATGEWVEVQPAGASDEFWLSARSDSDGSNLIAGAGSGRLWTSSDIGVNWTESRPAGNADRRWHASATNSDGSKLIAGDGSPGRLYTSTDGGANWVERQPAGATNQFWNFAESSSDGQFLMVGALTGRLYTSTDGGANWVERQPAGAVNRRWYGGACSADGVNLIAVTRSTGFANTGRVYTSTNGGVNWTERQPAGASDFAWNTAASSSDGSKLVVGKASGTVIFTSTDYGANWTGRVIAGAADCYSVAMSSDGTKILAATDIGLYLSVDSGDTWVDQFLSGTYWGCAGMDSDGSVMIAGVQDPGRIYVYS